MIYMTYKIPQYGIKVIVDHNGSSIESKLSEHLIDRDSSYDTQTTMEAVRDTIESLILAHASAGINVGSQAYIVGLNTTMDAIGNNL